MATKKEQVTGGIEINIPPIEKREATITIIGDTPLIMNTFSEKAKREILDKQMKKATKVKEAKNIWECFMESLHWITEKPKDKDGKVIYTEEAFKQAIENNAKFGFPAVGIKQSALSAGYRANILKNKVCMQGAFHIKEELVEIQGELSMREDMVRIPMGGADVVFRGEFKNWRSTFSVTYDKNVISLEQLIQLINYGGYAVGIGDWRPEKNGNHGMFHVATGDEV